MSEPALAQRDSDRGPFATVEEAIQAVARGEMVIIVDDEERENEGDLAIAAEKITPEAINFMAQVSLPKVAPR